MTTEKKIHSIYPNTGAYRLTLSVNKNIRLKVGKLGTIVFNSGQYIYTGSAMKNLEQRVARHFRLNDTKDKAKIHWHIDYLTTNTNVEIINAEYFPSEKREECLINTELLESNTKFIPIPGFGSSDCKTCISHLLKVY